MMPSEQIITKAYRSSIRHALGAKQIITHEDGLLVIDASGKIAACGEYSKLFSRLPKNISIEDFRRHWILPGFVDSHVHLPQLDCRNKNGLTLLDWLTTYIFPAEAKFGNTKLAEETSRRFFDELLMHGITTAAVHVTIHAEATDIAFQIAQEKGLRVVMGQVLMDQNAPDNLLQSHRRLLRETEQLISKWHGKEGRLFYAVTPRFAVTCSRPLLEGAGKLAKESGAYFQTHLAETEKENNWAKECHRFKDYVELYEQCHCLGNKSLFAHCIHLNDAEWARLADSRPSVAHCPTSNVFLKSGTMSISKIEKYQIRYGLGTDVGAGPTFSMFEVMDCACNVHPKDKMNSDKAFYLATLGGAEALSLEKQVGNFVEGKWADFSIVERETVKKVYISGSCVWGLSNAS